MGFVALWFGVQHVGVGDRQWGWAFRCTINDLFWAGDFAFHGHHGLWLRPAENLFAESRYPAEFRDIASSIWGLDDLQRPWAWALTFGMAPPIKANTYESK